MSGDFFIYFLFSALISVIGNLIIDRLGHKEVLTKQGQIPVRTPLTHTLPRSVLWGVGVIDVHNRRVETPEEVAKDILNVLNYFPPDKVWINPDCGLKLLSRKVAYQKLVSMVEGTKIAREELKKKGII